MIISLYCTLLMIIYGYFSEFSLTHNTTTNIVMCADFPAVLRAVGGVCYNGCRHTYIFQATWAIH